MKTHHPIIKGLIDFVDAPLDRDWRKANARRSLVLLATCWLAVIVWLIVQIAK
jgi:hypothetical protein